MKARKVKLALLAIGSLAISVSAYAGPPVNITFKHLGASNEPNAEYTMITQNESLTYAYASPKPENTVRPGNTDTYTVTNTLSPTINMAAVRYRIGGKTCEFYTAHLPGVGQMPPTWSKESRPRGGARCQATITRTNFNDNSWDIEFTMR